MGRKREGGGWSERVRERGWGGSWWGYLFRDEEEYGVYGIAVLYYSHTARAADAQGIIKMRYVITRIPAE